MLFNRIGWQGDIIGYVLIIAVGVVMMAIGAVSSPKEREAVLLIPVGLAIAAAGGYVMSRDLTLKSVEIEGRTVRLHYFRHSEELTGVSRIQILAKRRYKELIVRYDTLRISYAGKQKDILGLATFERYLEMLGQLESATGIDIENKEKINKTTMLGEDIVSGSEKDK